jgi:hypothetical protein
MGPELKETDVPEVRRQVQIDGGAVERNSLGFERVLPSQISRFSPTVMFWTLTSVSSKDETSWSALRAAAFVGKPPLPICRRLPYVSLPRSTMYDQDPRQRCGA